MARALVALAGVVPLLALAFPHPLAAPTFDFAGCTVADWSVDAEELAFLAIINDYRAENGLAPLALSENLNRAATWMASDMALNNRFGHTDSIGRGPFERTVACGYPVPAGENLAAGSKRGLATGAFELFRNSPSHNTNMLQPHYRQIGIARVNRPGSQHTWYWATNFGAVDDTVPRTVPDPNDPVLAWKAPPTLPADLPETAFEYAAPEPVLAAEQVAASSAEPTLSEALETVDNLVAHWQATSASLPAVVNLPVPEGRDGLYRVIIR